MTYFLSVKNKNGDFLRKDERHDTLDAVLTRVSERYLRDPEMHWRWSGYFAMRSGEITSLRIASTTAGKYLRDDVAEISILSERGYLERETHDVRSGQ